MQTEWNYRTRPPIVNSSYDNEPPPVQGEASTLFEEADGLMQAYQEKLGEIKAHHSLRKKPVMSVSFYDGYSALHYFSGNTRGSVAAKGVFAAENVAASQGMPVQHNHRDHLFPPVPGRDNVVVVNSNSGGRSSDIGICSSCNVGGNKN
jgi:hypothetical protein